MAFTTTPPLDLICRSIPYVLTFVIADCVVDAYAFHVLPLLRTMHTHCMHYVPFRCRFTFTLFCAFALYLPFIFTLRSFYFTFPGSYFWFFTFTVAFPTVVPLYAYGLDTVRSVPHTHIFLFTLTVYCLGNVIYPSPLHYPTTARMDLPVVILLFITPPPHTHTPRAPILLPLPTFVCLTFILRRLNRRKRTGDGTGLGSLWFVVCYCLFSLL